MKSKVWSLVYECICTKQNIVVLSDFMHINENELDGPKSSSSVYNVNFPSDNYYHFDGRKISCWLNWMAQGLHGNCIKRSSKSQAVGMPCIDSARLESDFLSLGDFSNRLCADDSADDPSGGQTKEVTSCREILLLQALI